jgi:hypothetical protein
MLNIENYFVYSFQSGPEFGCRITIRFKEKGEKGLINYEDYSLYLTCLK